MLKKKLIILISVLTVLISIFIGCFIYVNDYYKYNPDYEANSIDLVYSDDNTILFEATNSNVGFIFYPGGKVEYKAYIPLMQELKENGITCLLVDMPFNLAVLDINRADGLIEQFSDIESWYIGGHSLGGSMAASYLAKNINDYEGLILLGSYSTVDFSNANIKVLSVYGENDKILNKEKYNSYKYNIDDSLVEIMITGGNHAYYGMYGVQSSDGEATISNRDQIELTSQYIIEFTN